MSSVAVIGAGLVGCLAALGLSNRGYDVTIYELRDDPRKSHNKNLRSINLAVSDRGINALRYVDPTFAAKILSKVIPMSGRMIHKYNGELESQQYDLHGKSINSIDRSFLNEELLNEVESKGISVNFNHKLSSVNLDSAKPLLRFETLTSPVVNVDFVIGADGSFSKVRQELQKFVRMDYSQEYIDCAYLELSIPADEEGKFLLDKNHLHIWPRSSFMLIALPNIDGSFTSTFFAPWELIESLNEDSKILEFFQKEFPDSVKLIGKESLLHAFHHHPKGKLLSLKCNKYNYEDKVLIIGDAAHSMVPFYGQGMNCGFEDVFVLLELLEKNSDHLKKSFDEYTRTRHEDLLAIVDLAIGNYKEMSHKVNSKIFLIKKKIDFLLTYFLKDKWLPLYTMVSFRSDIKYSKAVATVKKQEKVLNFIQVIVLLSAAFGSFKIAKLFRKN
ncbi:hypothetical protein WICMUC_005772 [Wickerhamomyces mucosus]|uniref:Kynurenine 3-monooxygenase n=1 Tax=Wickerhamomyces mucosus TaxID=1378264 RepID=A0A9P8P368_9ASCO|nr:hypothetical protein WICMUC_005772 [Wickerhamomyces mucosus]